MISLRRAGLALVCAGLVVSAGCGSASPAAATIRFPKGGAAAPATPATSGEPGSTAVQAGTVEVEYGDTVKVDRSDFERELAALAGNKTLQEASRGRGLLGAGKNTLDPQLTAGWLTFVIHDKLVTHEVGRRRLAVTPADVEAGRARMADQFGSQEAVDAFPEWFRNRITARNARAIALRSALSGVDLSEDGLRRYFEDHKADFRQNCLSHILVKTQAEADAVVARLKAGEDFAAVARQVSADPGSRARGGDMGCNAKGTFVAEFDKAAGELPIGQVSDPVQTQFGFHVILVSERKDVSFETARDEIRARLDQQTERTFLDFLRQALTSARITVDKRYGRFERPPGGQVPTVVPPVPPNPEKERTDNVPTTEPLPGELPGLPETPTEPGG